MIWFEKYKTIIIGVCVVIVIIFMFLSQTKSSEITSDNRSSIIDQIVEVPQEEEIEAPAEKEKIFVDMKGAIKVPGLYEAHAGERVADLIERAGGLLKEADENLINFALKVEDEMVIYIPKLGEEGEIPINNSSTQKEDKVNINKATNVELQTLPGIGQSKAETIIEYREQHGPFEQIEDIQKISGIGAKTFEKLKEKITIK